jgi:GNAT superfamily N-acetyltransferase
VVDPHFVELAAEETYDLRRRVLRDGTATTSVVFDGDDHDTTFHLGIRVIDHLVAISTWMQRPYADLPATLAYQLRGMATEPDLRRHGYGSRLLTAGFERCWAEGATAVWARARDGALAFYERHGFAVVGLGYTDLATGLPHHDVLHLR